PYEMYEEDNHACVRIGDPNATISGEHEYRISYTVGGAFSYPDFGGADFYWDAVGGDWAVPIRSVVVRVSSPDNILLRERACYYGAEGKTLSCSIQVEEGGAIRFSGNNLRPHEGLTIAQALDRSKIAYDVRERHNMLPYILAF